MKLLNCQRCNDIIAIKRNLRMCECRACAAMYVEGGSQHTAKQYVKIAFAGPVRILGISNLEYTVLCADHSAQPIIFFEEWDDPAEDFEYLGPIADLRLFARFMNGGVRYPRATKEEDRGTDF